MGDDNDHVQATASQSDSYTLFGLNLPRCVSNGDILFYIPVPLTAYLVLLLMMALRKTAVVRALVKTAVVVAVRRAVSRVLWYFIEVLDASDVIDTLQGLKDKINALSNRNQVLENNVKKMKGVVNDLQYENGQLEEKRWDSERVKNDALKRLSKMVSEKLRDNNPNIVDLSDQVRPTKLAEMFSELYDNEWTTAYGALEKIFDNRKIVSFLLDVVMEAFRFCRLELEEQYKNVFQFCLNEESRKNMKDCIKSRLHKGWTEKEEEFIRTVRGMCRDQALGNLLSDKCLIQYMANCVKLCLLMRACDPPVYMFCPGFLPVNERKFAESEHDGLESPVSDDNARESEESIINNVHTGNPSSGNLTFLVDANAEETTGETESSEGGHRRNAGSSIGRPVVPVKRRCFDEEIFKYYTRKGQYLAYYVWPPMYLHEGGPLLCKGVAQGADKQMEDASDKPWLWWKVNSCATDVHTDARLKHGVTVNP